MGNRLHKAYREGTELLEGISPGARFLLWVYCELADDFTLITWPSVAELHRLTGMSERSVQVHLRVLEQKGRLVKVEAGGGRKYKAAYRVEMGPQPRERPPGTEGAPAPPSRPKPGPKP